MIGSSKADTAHLITSNYIPLKRSILLPIIKRSGRKLPYVIPLILIEFFLPSKAHFLSNIQIYNHPGAVYKPQLIQFKEDTNVTSCLISVQLSFTLPRGRHKDLISDFCYLTKFRFTWCLGYILTGIVICFTFMRCNLFHSLRWMRKHSSPQTKPSVFEYEMLQLLVIMSTVILITGIKEMCKQLHRSKTTPTFLKLTVEPVTRGTSQHHKCFVLCLLAYHTIHHKRHSIYATSVHEFFPLYRVRLDYLISIICMQFFLKQCS